MRDSAVNVNEIIEAMKNDQELIEFESCVLKGWTKAPKEKLH